MLARWVLLVAFVLAGCSGSSAGAPGDSAAAVATTEVGSSESNSTVPAETAPVESGPSETVPTETVPPATPYDSSEPVPETVEDPTSAWISRKSMTSTSIEVGWSAPEGAADYQVHRLVRTSNDEPDASEMNADNRLHSGDNIGVFLDTEVMPNTTYWHGVRGLDENGEVLSVGWHPTVALTDEQPPDRVELLVEQDGGSVLLTWSAPAENYELHSYRISRAVDGGEAEVVSHTWNLEQTSFLDTDPPVGVITYSVEAMDFHWNGSEPAEVTLDLS